MHKEHQFNTSWSMIGCKTWELETVTEDKDLGVFISSDVKSTVFTREG
jgi:hypothetical protein